ncbi:MAG: tRNA lysidine(34) synthetase TilS [Gemmatimonadaceae bacterium]|nr:tRNA lysidine(34) synthetase TilS [Gemmatimonadaceae bacterium]
MVLMHAMAQACASARAGGRVVVATFDHGTGTHARAAVQHVQRFAAEWGLPVVTGAPEQPLAGASEAQWRAARWAFLRGVTRQHDGHVVTAHTRDDQLETVVMRAMRGAGARGLSALRAPSAIRRPLLDVSREDVLAYAAAHAVAHVDDPGNARREHLRNRIRLDLLPAMCAADPRIAGDLLALADRAAALRTECTAAVAPHLLETGEGRALARQVTDRSWTPLACALYWQTVAEGAGLALDWRGTERLVHFAVNGRGGLRIPLSGGYEAVHRRDVVEIRRREPPTAPDARLNTDAETRFGRFRFRPVWELHPMTGDAHEEIIPTAGIAGRGEGHRDAEMEPGSEQDPWSSWLPAEATLEVRAWRSGDRMDSSGGRPRRVKRFFADRRVAAPDREGWPVVVADGEIVWIPGVRRGSAATVRPGRPRVCFVCERLRS